MTTLQGIAVSPGVALGPILILDPRGLALPLREVDPAQIAREHERLEGALNNARSEAEAAERDARSRLGPQYADILSAHARMIADPTLRRDAHELIDQEHIAAEHAVREVLDRHVARLEGLADTFLAARSADVRDIQRRILAQFSSGRAAEAPFEPERPGLLLAQDLTPSQAAALDPKLIPGFATEGGGRASHTAIVAAALEIPAVVGLGPFLDRARGCRTAIIDGDEGLVILDPDAATLKRYHRAAAERAQRFASLQTLAHLPAETRDGTRIWLHGNIEFPGEVDACRRHSADGIGLYRTEFLYLNSDRAPTEDEQVAAYSAVLRAMGDLPVTIRTLDLGADRLVSFQDLTTGGRNPSLGLRSIRLSLRDQGLFRTQLRAILRVSTLGPVRVLFPLITTLSELRQARALMAEVAGELKSQGVPVREDLPVGAMIEVPAAAMMADQLAREVDFFSIGTNDLIQYALAVDRTDETVADLYNAADPAVLRLIALVVSAAQGRGIEVNVCGSMGGDPLYSMILIGLGLRHLSMPPHQLPEIKRIVRACRLEQAESLARTALELDTAGAVLAHIRAALADVLPEPPSGAAAIG